ncbi:Flavin reductase like domain-containing protein [Raineyella antarctica]|uniref:Flavin reductase like domain-containing protein n=1 Tax=Raineyella antarctica TaxID=1577474 RepID=A0A1G6HCN3_9ACTN|nr:flavin reductase family protein [Raineyella antarctica]SDB91838.1 Flavin reductase like domain-containing protein [Raineyella antarctica]
MSIHGEHPFLTPPELRDPVRRLRGHLPAPVTVWASAHGGRRDGWTISSVLVGEGEPAELVALVDEDCDWWDLFRDAGTATVSVLAAGQGAVADAFARVAPSPGGPFRTGEWVDAPHGPRLSGAAGWVGVRLVDPDPPRAGWGLLVRARIEDVALSEGLEALEHRRGRYR